MMWRRRAKCTGIQDCSENSPVIFFEAVDTRHWPISHFTDPHMNVAGWSDSLTESCPSSAQIELNE